MKREFIETTMFLNNWDNIGLNDDVLNELETFLLSNPQAGEIIPGSGGIRKMRWELPGRGKRAGARIVYIDFISYEKIYLLAAYPKNVKVDLTADELRILRALVKSLKESLSRGGY